MHQNCLSTVICCGWAYGWTLTLTLLYLCRWGPAFWKIEVRRSPNVLCCHGRGCKPPLIASHIHIGSIQSVQAPSYAVDGHMGAPLHGYICAGGGQILENWGKAEPTWDQGVVVEAVNHHWLHPTSIMDAYIFLIHSYAVDGHMGAPSPLHCYTGAGGGQHFGKLG